MRKAIRERVVVVTGASSGIGRATAIALGHEGARLVLGARREALLVDLAAEISAYGGQAIAVTTDVTVRDQVHNLMKRAVEQWDHIDVVVVNAGIWMQAPVEETADEQWRTVMEVDFFGAVYTTLEALPHLAEDGQLIFVNSLEGKKGVPLEAAYTAAKHALSGFAGVARQELASRRVTVTNIYPGRVDTALIDRLHVPAIQAKMPADRVAQAVLSAIKRPRREIYVPAIAGRAFAWLGTFAPGLTDRITRLFKLQGRM